MKATQITGIAGLDWKQYVAHDVCFDRLRERQLSVARTRFGASRLYAGVREALDA